MRRPALELDSLYGSGPSFVDRHSQDAGFYDGPKFRLGRVTPVGGAPIPPNDDLDRDLPRVGPLMKAGVITEDVLTDEQRANPSKNTLAFIGDARNDENLVVAQLHLGFLRFHNQVVEEIKAHPKRFGFFGPRHDAVIFERARELARWHYQWIVVHDWLKTVTLSGIVDKVLLGGPKHYKPRHDELFMPLEYSVAGFRFGHSMVRGAYDHNRNFGREQNDPTKLASLNQLFLFTGEGFQVNADGSITRNPMLGLPTLPSNWIIEWDRFTDKTSPDTLHFTRKLDTFLTPTLLTMPNAGNSESSPIREMLKSLPQRNLLRGYLLSIPTGQAVAKALGVPALTVEELRKDNAPAMNAALDQGGFIDRTPLWYYILKEAEVRGNGNSLGEAGSRLIAETIIGLLVHDRNSYLNQRGGWDPSEGVKLPNGDLIVTLRDFLRFAGVAP